MLRDRCVTCSISPGTYSVKLVWYLANIFSIGRRCNHHWTLGILCLQNKRQKFSKLASGRQATNTESYWTHNNNDIWQKSVSFCSAYSKSVTAFSSETGVNEMTFLWRPSTHAVSGELANTRPSGRRLKHYICIVVYLWRKLRARYDFRTAPPLKVSVNRAEIHWMALTPILVPKFLSKGEGDPP